MHQLAFINKTSKNSVKITFSISYKLIDSIIDQTYYNCKLNYFSSTNYEYIYIIITNIDFTTVK